MSVSVKLEQISKKAATSIVACLECNKAVIGVDAPVRFCSEACEKSYLKTCKDDRKRKLGELKHAMLFHPCSSCGVEVSNNEAICPKCGTVWANWDFWEARRKRCESIIQEGATANEVEVIEWILRTEDTGRTDLPADLSQALFEMELEDKIRYDQRIRAEESMALALECSVAELPYALYVDRLRQRRFRDALTLSFVVGLILFFILLAVAILFSLGESTLVDLGIEICSWSFALLVAAYGWRLSKIINLTDAENFNLDSDEQSFLEENLIEKLNLKASHLRNE